LNVAEHTGRELSVRARSVDVMRRIRTAGDETAAALPAGGNLCFAFADSQEAIWMAERLGLVFALLLLLLVIFPCNGRTFWNALQPLLMD